MGMYNVFETNKEMEQNGVWVDYGDFRVLIASAGQGNKSYVSYAEKKLKPLRRALEAGAVSNERSQAAMADIYAKTVVLDWEVLTKDDMTGEPIWTSGIEQKDGSIVEFTQEAVEAVFLALPRLFLDIQEQAGSLSNFRLEELEKEGKNS